MKGIMFIEPLYNRTLEGIKVMTRRDGGLSAVNGDKKKGIITNPDDWDFHAWLFEPKNLSVGNAQFINKHTGEPVICKSNYRVDDIVYLKEPWAFAGDTNVVIYKFGYPDNVPPHFENVPTVDKVRWENKMYMGADKARKYIRITGVSVERLHDISVADCIAEGIETSTAHKSEVESYTIYKDYLEKTDLGTPIFSKDPKRSFFSLYKFANKKKEVPNLWVWVYSYELLFSKP